MEFITLDYTKNSKLYNDFTSCLFALNKYWSRYEPESGDQSTFPLVFHTYTEFKEPKQLMCAASFLASQPKHYRMIVWSDYDISSHEIFTQSCGRIVNNVWDPDNESKGTLLEGKSSILNARDQRYWLQSDLCRILALHKYGGVWIDMDVILINPFTPLAKLEYLYAWGSDFDFAQQGACGSVMALNVNSELSTVLLQALSLTTPVKCTTCWGKDLFAKVYQTHSYRILPCTFFNTEWCINSKYPGFAEYIELGWFKDRIDNIRFMFPEAFAWHWHNSSKSSLLPENGSKFDILVKYTINQLHSRGYRDLAGFIKNSLVT